MQRNDECDPLAEMNRDRKTESNKGYRKQRKRTDELIKEQYSGLQTNINHL